MDGLIFVFLTFAWQHSIIECFRFWLDDAAFLIKLVVDASYHCF